MIKKKRAAKFEGPYSFCTRLAPKMRVPSASNRPWSVPAIKCDHSHAWQPRKAKPPMTVHSIHFSTAALSIRWPASTASTMVTLLRIRIKVIIPTKINGRSMP